jgi:hypothetical protein
MASANDDSELKRWAAAWSAYEQEDRLIVPDSADWLMASKVLYWLMQRRKKRAGGEVPAAEAGRESAHGARCTHCSERTPTQNNRGHGQLLRL